MWSQNKLKGLVLIFEGIGTEFEEGRERRKGGEMVTDTKPEMCLVNLPPHHVGGETFQTPPWKAIFGGWAALHTLPLQNNGYPHASACTYFF